MNKLNTALLKSLVDSEFLILSSNCKQNNKKIEYKISSHAKNRVESSLNLFELIKTLKQFIRVLQFLKHCKDKEFILCSSNINILSFLRSYQKEFSLPEFLSFEQNFPKLKTLTSFRSLLLIEELPTLKSESFLRNFFKKNILLLTKINAVFERGSYGTYKIYNDMSDYKKLIFLMVIVKKGFE